MLVAMAVFVVNDTLFKLAAAHMPTGEAIFLRGVFAPLLLRDRLLPAACAGRCRTLSRRGCCARLRTSARPCSS